MPQEPCTLNTHAQSKEIHTLDTSYFHKWHHTWLYSQTSHSLAAKQLEISSIALMRLKSN